MHPRFVSAAAAIGLAILCSAALAQSPAPTPPNLATAHAQQSKLACNACHGDKTPTSVTPEESLATVNQNCVNCHGDAKSLAEKLAPKLVHKEINPHGSHLVEIDCVTCHRGHAASEAYCQQCHAFDMTMPPKAKK
jgi:fumarate reductase flavoprotein subunit